LEATQLQENKLQTTVAATVAEDDDGHFSILVVEQN
jgi:hypothetical protein